MARFVLFQEFEEENDEKENHKYSAAVDNSGLRVRGRDIDEREQRRLRAKR